MFRPHDGGAGAGEDALRNGRAGVHLTAFLSVGLAERLERDEPLVELHPNCSEWILLALVRPGDEAVERHRDAQPQLAHRSSLAAD
jgi:hypothetical protein